MDGTQSTLLVLILFAGVSIGGAIVYVILKGRMSEESWKTLVDIVKRARVIWGQVYTVEQAAFVAKRLYGGLRIERFGYTQDEFVQMFLWLVPISDPEAAYAFSAEAQRAFSFEDAQLQTLVDTIVLDAKRQLEVG